MGRGEQRTPLKTMRLTFIPLLAAVLASDVGCTNAGVYALNGGGVPGPDRTAFLGTVCVPLAQGAAFPVKVVFALEGGTTTVTQAVSSSALAAIAQVAQLQPSSTTFTFIAYHVTAQGFVGAGKQSFDGLFPEAEGGSIVLDEIGLAQLTTSGVHTLKYELRIVLVAIESDVHHYKLRQSFTHCDEVAFASSDQFFEELEILRHSERRFLWLLCTGRNGSERNFVRLRQDEFVVPLAGLFGIEQVVVAELARGEAIHRLGLPQRLG